MTYNASFADVAMEVRDGSIVNFEFFKEDLLVIQRMQVVAGRWEVDHTGALLDVGWYPDSDPAGAYTLTVVRGAWDAILFRVRTRDADVIRAAIERILDGLYRGESIDTVRMAVGGVPPNEALPVAPSSER